jgi:hypothetical protein
MHVQAFVSERTIEGFDKAIIGGLARAAEVNLHAVVIRPKIHESTRELAAVVDEDSHRRSTYSDYLIAGINNILAAETLTDSNAQRFARKDIDHRQRTQLATIGELISDEIH